MSASKKDVENDPITIFSNIFKVKDNDVILGQVFHTLGRDSFRINTSMVPIIKSHYKNFMRIIHTVMIVF